MEGNNNNSFPAEWQQYDCPPESSEFPKDDDKYFRVVKNKPATGKDFLNAVEEDSFKNHDMCSRLSISLLNTEHGAFYHREIFQWKEDWHIAQLKLTSDHGKVKDTPSRKQPAHADWWPYPTVTRESTVTTYVIKK